MQGLSAEIYRGEKIAFLGPNGVGKTTLLRLLLRELEPLSRDASEDDFELRLRQVVPFRDGSWSEHGNNVAEYVVLHWQVADADVFVRAVAGDSVRAERRIDDLVVYLLRARVARLRAAELPRENPILDTAGGALSGEDMRQTETDKELLQALNDRTRDFGIAVDRLRLERL